MRRRAVPLVLAFVLGLAAAFAASCTSTGVKGGLPETSATDLKAQIADVQEFVDRGDCDGIDGQLRQVQQAIDNLPGSTDESLVTNLRDGAAQLQTAALAACNSPETQTQTAPPETVTEQVPTVTEPPSTTTTTPPETTTTPVPPDTTQTQPPADPTQTEPVLPGETNGGAGVTP